MQSNVVAMKLSYTTQRAARRRKLTITMERDRSIVVHAPAGISDERIQKLVESKQQWIHDKIKHPQKYQALPHPPGKELVSGESALYLGRQYLIEMILPLLGRYICGAAWVRYKSVVMTPRESSVSMRNKEENGIKRALLYYIDR